MLRPDREGYGLMGIRDAWREVAPMLSLGAPSVALPKRGRSGPSFASRDARTVRAPDVEPTWCAEFRERCVP